SGVAAEQESEGAEQERLSGSGFAGDDGQTGPGLETSGGDDAQVAYDELVDHPFIPARTSPSGSEGRSGSGSEGTAPGWERGRSEERRVGQVGCLMWHPR